MDWHYSDHSDDDAANDVQPSNRKRSSRACDQCRKTKSKCERSGSSNTPCKSCIIAGTVCTFLGPSYKRGPPKGYIHAIEQRWHQVESLLGAIIQCPDPQVQRLVTALSQDDLAQEIIRRVDNGPYGPTGRRSQRDGATKEDFFASILKSNESGSTRDSARSRRQSRVSREIVSSTHDIGVSSLPTKEWQDNLSSFISKVSCSDSPPSARRRKLDSMSKSEQPPLNWDEMYTLEPEADEVQETLDAIGGLSVDENQEVRYHGKSSGLHILSQATVRTDDRLAGGVWRLPLAEAWPGTCHLENSPEQDINTHLPPIHVQDRLIDLYFDYVHPMFPVLHMSRFMIEYNIRKRNSGTRQRSPDHPLDAARPGSSQEVTPLLLFAIFAITARFCEGDFPPPQPGMSWEAGCTYSRSARAILTKGFRQARPSKVQALLLMGYREFGMGSTEQAWLFIGMAMRMAVDLGLNRDPSTWKIDGRDMFSSAEIQTRSQIWWSCCLADRYGSLYLGRPIVLKDEDFDIPPPTINLDEDEKSWPSSRLGLNPLYPPVPGQVASCFRALATLALISGSLVNHIYPVRRASFVTRKAKYVETEKRLDQWFIGLPDHLQYDVTSRAPVPPPHVLFLHIRYWAVTLLLNRAFIPISKATESSSHNSLELRAFDLAQGAANHITTIVTIYRETFTLKRVSPFLPSSVLAAAIMHLLTLALRPSDPRASLGFQQCMTALEDMKMVWPSAARAWELLSGVKTRNGTSVQQRPGYAGSSKRPADAAFMQERVSGFLQGDAFKNSADLNVSDDVSGQNGVQQNGAQELGTRLMAHMLGINIPSMEASTSYCGGYEWWPRSYGDASSSNETTPSPLQGDPKGASPAGNVLPAVNTPMPPEWTQVHNNYSYDFNRFSL